MNAKRRVDITQITAKPIRLDGGGKGHAVYWLGNDEPSAFRTNVYLIVDGDWVLLVDPGNRACFAGVRERVAQVVDPARVSGMILCHQDSDVAASMPDWLAVNPQMRVFTSPRTQVLLPHYGCADYAYADVEAEPVLARPSGGELYFVPAPFLHFPGAFATFDTASGFLFSGDVFASLDVGSRLWAEGFDELAGNMQLFHTEYMASNIAARGFVNRLQDMDLDIRAILPQHGSLIGEGHLPQAMQWLAGLRCGTDLIYPEL
jgi:flavorubredoxin